MLTKSKFLADRVITIQSIRIKLNDLSNTLAPRINGNWARSQNKDSIIRFLKNRTYQLLVR